VRLRQSVRYETKLPRRPQHAHGPDSSSFGAASCTYAVRHDGNKWAKASTAHLNQLVNFARQRMAAEAAAAAGICCTVDC
jgi:hypothetical protein